MWSPNGENLSTFSLLEGSDDGMLQLGFLEFVHRQVLRTERNVSETGRKKVKKKLNQFDQSEKI